MRSSVDPARAWIEIEVEASSIAGALHRGDEPVRQFDGWLELVSLLEDLRRPRDDGDQSEHPIDSP
jgi:hypothetical protein